MKYFIYLIFISTTLFSQHINNNNIISNSSQLIKKLLEFNLEYSNSFEKYVALEQYKSYNFNIKFKPYDSNVFLLNYENSKIDYRGFQLHNQKIDIATNYQFFNNTYNSYSIKLGYIRNKSDDLMISYWRILDSVLEKTLPNIKIDMKKDGLYIDDIALLIYDENGNLINPSININNLYSDTIYTKLYAGFYEDNQILDFYMGYYFNSINGFAQIVPKVKYFEDEKYQFNLQRDELMFLIGLSYKYQYDYLKLEFNYEYNKFIREKIKEISHNQILDLVLNLNLYDNINIYTSAKYMTHQFISDIPYSYNEFTFDKFEKHYAYIKSGILISF